MIFYLIAFLLPIYFVSTCEIYKKASIPIAIKLVFFRFKALGYESIQLNHYL